MLVSIEKLLEGRPGPLCVNQSQTIREALTLMVEHDYSQLPVIDDDGKLRGLISTEEISHEYFHLGGAVSLLDLPVHQCLAELITLTRDRDITEALDYLKDHYAIVVIETGKPVGILTNFDIARFFRDLTEDQLIVEDIETSLRQLVQSVCSDEVTLTGALIADFGEERERPGAARKDLDDLTFGELIRFIRHDKMWSSVESYLGPAELFGSFMEMVRQHRNQLFHFRGRLDTVQHSALLMAQRWLQTRPRPQGPRLIAVKTEDLQKAERSRSTPGGGQYDAMRTYLESQKVEGLQSVGMTFADIEELLGEKLPQSAREHRAWWANHYGNPQAKAWLAAGWLVDNVDQTLGEVSFRQSRAANYPVIFDELLKRLKAARPGITSAAKASLDNWVSFSPFKPGFMAGWALPRESVLRVELYIDNGKREENKARFDALYAQKNAIETAIGAPLDWDRLDDRQGCRISASRPFDVTAPMADREPILDWGVNMMLNLIDTFLPRISSL